MLKFFKKSKFGAFIRPSTLKTEIFLKKFKGRLYIEESFDTIFNIGYGVRKTASYGAPDPCYGQWGISKDKKWVKSSFDSIHDLLYNLLSGLQKARFDKKISRISVRTSGLALHYITFVISN